MFLFDWNKYFIKVILSFVIIFVLPFNSNGQENDYCIKSENYGHIISINSNSSLIISAPHGISDRHTEKIVYSLCISLKTKCVIASRFRNKNFEINVNRPTEGKGLRSTDEKFTNRAKHVFNCYKSHLSSIMNKNSKNIYLEIHGNSSKTTKNFVEIATNNVSNKEAQMIKNIMNNYLNEFGYSKSELQIKIQGLDKIYYVGNATKKFGTFKMFDKSFAFEIPAFVRDNEKERNKFTKVLYYSFKDIEKHL